MGQLGRSTINFRVLWVLSAKLSPPNLTVVAYQLITNEDLVALYCGGAGGTRATSYKLGAQSRRKDTHLWNLTSMIPLSMISVIHLFFSTTNFAFKT